jgi:cytochrome b pre-mRNA-processing protein 3
MIFNVKKHTQDLYNILLALSRNILFYKNINLPDTFETRIYLMYIHFSIMMIVYRKKGKKFAQKEYDFLFYNIENNLRELGFGDVSVNKKMKEFNKILYDILLKLDLDKNNSNSFKINHNLISKYFNELNDPKSTKFNEFKTYFNGFFYFCFELPIDNMIREAINYKK